jgi:hypothetical protein
MLTENVCKEAGGSSNAVVDKTSGDGDSTAYFEKPTKIATTKASTITEKISAEPLRENRPSSLFLKLRDT